MLMSLFELHLCPISFNILLAKHNDGPPTLVNTINYLVRNHLSRNEVSCVNLALRCRVFSVGRSLKFFPDDVLQILRIMMGVGDECIVFLVLVYQVSDRNNLVQD